MFTWIWDNKAWLFSGIGVAIIIAFWRTFAKLVTRKSDLEDKPAFQNISQTTTINPTFNVNPVIKIDGLGGDKGNSDKTISHSTTKQQDTTTLDANLIRPLQPTALLDEFKKASPFFQAEVAKRYSGIRVEWEGGLSHVTNLHDGTVSISILYDKNGPYISFSVDTNRYPGLTLLRVEDRIRVQGTICSIDLFSINLTDAIVLKY